MDQVYLGVCNLLIAILNIKIFHNEINVSFIIYNTRLEYLNAFRDLSKVKFNVPKIEGVKENRNGFKIEP